MMDQETIVEESTSLHVKEEANNNHATNLVKQSVYDVLGGDDQELARRQYLDDDVETFDSDERTDELSQRRRPGANAKGPVQADESAIDVGQANGRSRSTFDDNISNANSTNGYSRNGSSNHDNEIEGQRQPHHSEEPEQMRKLFIGGLDYKTSEATLKQHFEKFGDVLDCVVMREPQSKRSRGFGFVIYANSLMVDKAQDARPHEVDGREVQSKRAISREDSGKPEAQATVKKVYLGGLSDDIEESELRDYFKDFGNIVNVNIVAHKDTGKRRGFAFVEYDDYDPVDKIVLKKFHTVKDKRIEAKKAIPKVEMDARKRGDPRAAMAGAMIALSGLPIDSRSVRPRPGRSASACLWDSPYNTSGYPPNYSSQASYGYPSHYHSPSAHYGSSNWMAHEGQGGSPYGFRSPHENGAYGRSSYANQPGNWTTDYSGFSSSQGGGGGGPMRLSYQHRGLGPYGTGYGTHRGRGYNQ